MTLRSLIPFVVLAACQPDESLVAYGADGIVWELTAINGAAYDAAASVQFFDDGRVSGQAPCNRFSTQQTAPYPWIDLEPILATKRACSDLAAEQNFFAALTEMQLAELSGPVLILSNEAGDEMEFKALNGAPTDP